MPKVPVKKTARKATKAATVKKTAATKAAPVKTAAKKAAVKKAPAAKKTAVARKAPARKAAAKAPAVTRVIARIDAGFGNSVFIRGGAAGLSWDAGTLMENTGSDEWVWQSTAVASELEFKVLLNDEVWSSGPNGVVFPGATVVLEPVF
jgi:hypothetical protein